MAKYILSNGSFLGLYGAKNQLNRFVECSPPWRAAVQSASRHQHFPGDSQEKGGARCQPSDS
jgi:hypothetical protein